MKSSLKIFEMFETLLFFFKQKYFILGDIFFKIPKNLFLGIFLPRQILKNIDMPWQKARMLHW